MSFLALPPEVNSGLILAGAGSQPMLAAATAWSGLSDELFIAADSFGSIVAGLTAAAWQGPAMAATALPFRNWLSAVAAEAGQAAAQAKTMTALIETVSSAVVPPVMVAANRSELVSLASVESLRAECAVDCDGQGRLRTHVGCRRVCDVGIPRRRGGGGFGAHAVRRADDQFQCGCG